VAACLAFDLDTLWSRRIVAVSAPETMLRSGSGRFSLGLILALLAVCALLVHELRVQTKRADAAIRTVRSLEQDVARLREDLNDRRDAERLPSVSQAPALARPPDSDGIADRSDHALEPVVASPSNVRKWVAADAYVITRQLYGPLLERLSLTSQQKEDLLALLAAEREDGTSTPHSNGSPPKSHERIENIASVIGYPNLQSFETFESKLAEYAQAQELGSQLTTAGQPMTESQRQQFVDLLASERARTVMDTQSTKMSSVDDLEEMMKRKDDYERRVLEGAAIFLSRDQTKLLEELYASRSARRAMAVDVQRKRSANSSDGPLWYPPDQ
jgi:hypothetical protein